MFVSYRIYWILSVLLLILALGGCGWIKKTSKPKKDEPVLKKNTLYVGTTKFPERLDPTQVQSLSRSVLEMNVFEGLMAPSFTRSSIEFVPRLAKNVAISSDGLVYTFEIHSGVKWSDGQPLRASHFVDAFEVLLSPEGNPLAREFFAIVNAKKFREGKIKDFSQVGVKAIDDKTLTITLGQKENFFLNLLFHPVTFPVRKEFIGNIKDWTKLYQTIPTLGPFVVTEVVPGKSITLGRNKNYPVAKPFLESVIIRYSDKNSQLMADLSGGRLDAVMGVATERFQRVDAKTVTVPSYDWTLGIVSFNVKQKPFDNPIFRRVLAMALNREEILSNAGPGFSPFPSLIPPGFPGFESNRGIRFDPNAARVLLRKSHAGNLQKLMPFRLRFENVGLNQTFSENIASLIKKNLDIDIVLENEKFWDKVTNTEPPTMYLMRIQPQVPDPQSLLSAFDKGAPSEIMNWKNRNYAQEVRNSGLSKSPQSRARVFAKAQHLMLEKEAAIIPIYLESKAVIFGPRVRNIPEASFGVVPFDQVSVE